MAAVIQDLILSNSTDATFRGWGKAVSDQLAAFGWVKTADAGQIDWATAAMPAIRAARGYEIWRMNDALQAIAPVFMKLEYGAGNTYQNSPAVWITLGTGSSGAGELTGQVSTRAWYHSYEQASTTVAYRCLFSGDPSRFNMCLGVTRDSDNSMLWLNVERSKNAAGADTADGVFRCGASYGSTSAQYLPFTGVVPAHESGIGCMGPGAGTGATGGDVNLYPVFPFNGKMLHPIRGAAGYFKADVPQDTIIETTIFGATQRFYCVGHSVTSPLLRGANTGLALRYE